MTDNTTNQLIQAPVAVAKEAEKVADKVEDSVESRFNALVAFLKQHGIYFQG